jgi:hypothetical protein
MWISKVAIILDVNLHTSCDSIAYAICRTVTKQTVQPPQEWVTLLRSVGWRVSCQMHFKAISKGFFFLPPDWILFHYCSMLNTIIIEELVLCVRCSKNRGVWIILLLNLMIKHSFQFNSILYSIQPAIHVTLDMSSIT